MCLNVTLISVSCVRVTFSTPAKLCVRFSTVSMKTEQRSKCCLTRGPRLNTTAQWAGRFQRFSRAPVASRCHRTRTTHSAVPSSLVRGVTPPRRLNYNRCATAMFIKPATLLIPNKHMRGSVAWSNIDIGVYSLVVIFMCISYSYALHHVYCIQSIKVSCHCLQTMETLACMDHLRSSIQISIMCTLGCKELLRQPISVFASSRVIYLILCWITVTYFTWEQVFIECLVLCLHIDNWLCI